MSAEAVVYSLLSGAVPVTAITGQRIWPASAPPNEARSGVDLLAYVSYFVESSEMVRSTTRVIGKVPLVRIKYWAPTFTQLLALGQAIENALDGQTGTVATFKVKGIVQEDRDDSDVPLEGIEAFEGSQLFRVVWSLAA